MTNDGSVRARMLTKTSGASDGLSGTTTRPALAIPSLLRCDSTEFSQTSTTRSLPDRPAARSALPMRLAMALASRYVSLSSSGWANAPGQPMIASLSG